MVKLTLRNLAAHKARFAMTTFAVVLGVGFVVASFVLSDGLRSTFGDLSNEITDGTDLEVRPVSEFGEPIPLDEALIDDVASTDGVRVAAGFVEAGENAVQPIKADGTTIDTFGPPQLMFSWIDDAELGSFTVVEGQPPSAPGEFTMDVDAAANHDFVLGETYDLITPSGLAQDYELVGVTSFGADNDTVGATLMHVTLDEAQILFGNDGEVDAIPISLAGGADLAAVTAALADVIPVSGAEIVDNATLTAEQQAEFDEGIDIIGNFLLGFAIVSLFVSIFIIYNTFSIVLGQRVRELGLMRAIGTGSRQIRRSVMGEALVVGGVASAVGIGAGVGLARALEALFSALGASLPESPTIIAARTIVLAVALGVGVTVVSAIAPARAAGRVSPISAMRDGVEQSTMARPRVALGAALVAVGLVAGGIGLFGGVGTAALIGYLGLGSVAIFVGVTMTSPVIARPAARVMGWPIARIMGRSGHLARENAARNPRRTATTGAALMIGLSLVSAVLVVGESVKARLGDLIEESVSADYVMFDDSEAGFAPVLAEDLEATGQFEYVSAFRYDDALVNGEVRELTAAELAAVPSLFDLDVRSGEIPTNGQTNVILVPVDTAEDLGRDGRRQGRRRVRVGHRLRSRGRGHVCRDLDLRRSAGLGRRVRSGRRERHRRMGRRGPRPRRDRRRRRPVHRRDRRSLSPDRDPERGRVPGPVRGQHRQRADRGERHARPGHRHRPDRDRQHPRPLGERADSRARTTEGGRYDPASGPPHGPLGGGAGRLVRCGSRRRDRRRVRMGHRQRSADRVRGCDIGTRGSHRRPDGGGHRGRSRRGHPPGSTGRPTRCARGHQPGVIPPPPWS